MKLGDIWQVELGGKSGKRPAVILTRANVIPFLNKITVAEITSQAKGYPTEVAIGQQANLATPSFIQPDNMQTIPKQRFLRHLGTLSDAIMIEVSEKIVFALALEDVIISA